MKKKLYLVSICLASFFFSHVDAQESSQPPVPAVTIQANEDWVPLSFPDRHIRKEGSALDVSPYFPFQKCGEHGQIIINAQGHLAFEDNPDTPVKFYTNSVDGAVIRACKTHEDIKQFCLEMRKSGYNMIRTHFLDLFFMRFAQADCEFPTAELELFDYLIYQMKENGIYLNFDCMTNFMGYTKGNGWLNRTTPECFKGRICFDETVRKNWRKGVESLLCRVNPYTKTRLVDEPLLALTVGYNEQEFGFMRAFKTELLTPAFHNFLKRHYGTIENLNEQNGKNFASFDDVPLFAPEKQQEKYDWLFMNDAETEIIQWYRKQLDEIGCKAPLSNFNMVKDQHYNCVRSDSEYISINSYNDHPWNNLHSITQKSAIGEKARHFRDAVSARLVHKPFVVTEYSSVFWNTHRNDHSFSFASYAAFQNFDALTSHASSVSLRRLNENEGMSIFETFIDPIRIAAEYLGFFMFVRGDITPADRFVRISVDKDTVYDSAENRKSLSQEQTALSLITGFSIECLGKNDTSLPLADNEIAIPRQGSSETVLDLSGFSQTKGDVSGAENIIRYLKEKKIIPKDNASDGQSIFETVTGEIYLDSNQKFMRINTPRLQGFTAEPGTDYEAADFSVHQLDEQGMVAVVSIDGLEPIKHSKRMTLVYATNAMNNKMTFADKEMKTVIDFGGSPILLKTGRFTATITNDNAEGMKLYALDMGGKRIKEIDTQISGNTISFTIDTKEIGPHIFFEMVCEE